MSDHLSVVAALATLPATFRAAVVLRDLADLDYAEIGEILHVPPGTVRSRIARGRAQLARLLVPQRALESTGATGGGAVPGPGREPPAPDRTSNTETRSPRRVPAGPPSHPIEP